MPICWRCRLWFAPRTSRIQTSRHCSRTSRPRSRTCGRPEPRICRRSISASCSGAVCSWAVTRACSSSVPPIRIRHFRSSDPGACSRDSSGNGRPRGPTSSSPGRDPTGRPAPCSWTRTYGTWCRRFSVGTSDSRFSSAIEPWPTNGWSWRVSSTVSAAFHISTCSRRSWADLEELVGPALATGQATAPGAP